jgi:hypothetical protein
LENIKFPWGSHAQQHAGGLVDVVERNPAARLWHLQTSPAAAAACLPWCRSEASQKTQVTAV